MTPIRKGTGASPYKIYANGSFKDRVYLGSDLVWQKAPGTGAWIFTHDGSSYQLQTISTGTYSFDVDWGDGTTNTITTWDQTEVTHSYSGTGPWTVRIEGTFKGVQSNTLSKAHCLEIKNWGCMQNTNGFTFSGHTKMIVTATDLPDLSQSANLQHMFKSCSELVSIPNLDKWTLPSVAVGMAEMFRFCPKFTGAGLSDWDMSTCTTIAYMFQNCSVFNEDISGWNTANVTSMVYTFSGCSAFNRAIGSWNTAKVTGMNYLFYYCGAFNQSLTNWNTAKVQNMKYAFMNSAFTGSLAGWSIEGITVSDGLLNLLNGTAMPTADYDATLNSWAAQTIPAVIDEAHFGTSKYSSAGAASRTYLVDTEGWAITDGGLEE